MKLESTYKHPASKMEIRETDIITRTGRQALRGYRDRSPGAMEVLEERIERIEQIVSRMAIISGIPLSKLDFDLGMLRKAFEGDGTDDEHLVAEPEPAEEPRERGNVTFLHQEAKA